jgi:sensor domain CHASE-containing protein
MLLIFFIIVLCLWIATIAFSYVIMSKMSERLDAYEKLENATEEALNVLDASYARISTTLNVPVSSDDAFTRNVINEIKVARKSLLHAAKILSESEVTTIEEN